MLIFESSFATLPLFEMERKQKIFMMSFQLGLLMGALALAAPLAPAEQGQGQRQQLGGLTQHLT